LFLNFHINVFGDDSVNSFSRGHCVHSGGLVKAIIDYESMSVASTEVVDTIIPKHIDVEIQKQGKELHELLQMFK
jgi:hypothetical protein